MFGGQIGLGKAFQDEHSGHQVKYTMRPCPTFRGSTTTEWYGWLPNDDRVAKLDPQTERWTMCNQQCKSWSDSSRLTARKVPVEVWAASS
jgi:hypothetical protein